MVLFKLRHLIGRTNSKVLLENFFSLSILQSANYLLPLVTLPYLTRVIGVELFGEFAVAAAIIIYFQTFVSFGFDYTATRNIAKVQSDTWRFLRYIGL